MTLPYTILERQSPDLYTEAELAAMISTRQSDANSIMLCGQRVALRDHPGFLDSPSEPRAFGSLVHKLNEMRMEGDADALYPTRDQVADIWAVLLRKDDPDFNLFEVATTFVLNQGVAEALAAHRAWVENFWARRNPNTVISVEETKHLFVEYKGKTVWIHGTADMAATDGLWDWKTAGRGWSQGKELVQIQAPTYAALYAEDYDNVFPIPFNWYIWDRAKSQWSLRRIVVPEAASIAAIRTLCDFALAKDSGNLPATPYGESYGKGKRGWHCSAKYCGAWNICPYKALVVDDVDLSEKINPLATWQK